MNRTTTHKIDRLNPKPGESPALILDDNERSVRDTAGKRLGDIIDPSARTFRMAAFAADLAAGRTVTMDLGDVDVRVGGTLTTFGSVPNDFVADTIAPVVMVEHDRGSYFAESTDDTIAQVLPIGDSSSGGARTPELNPNFTGTAFRCDAYALSSEVPLGTLANADFDVLAFALARIVENLQLSREIRVKTLVSNGANWTSNNLVTIAAAAKWNGGASKAPLTDLFGRMAASSLPITAVIIPEKLEPFFGTSPDVVNFIMAGRSFPKIVVARGRTKLGGLPSYIWQNDVILIREPENATALSTARTLRFLGGPRDGEAVKEGFLVREYYLAGTGTRGTRGVAVVHEDAEVMLSNSVGGLISAAYQ